MKKLIISLLVVAAFVAAPVSMFAALTETVNGTSKASIVSSISIANSADGLTGDAAYLDFGAVSKGTGGTVIISTAGAASSTGDVVLITSPRSAASFTVQGTTGADFNVSIPETTIELSGVNTNTNKITVNGLNSSITNSTIGTGGKSVFTVGGTLVVGATQADDLYQGTFAVNVAYN